MSNNHEPASTSTILTIPAAILRYGVFTLLIFGSIFAIWSLAKHHGGLLFVEDSPMEWAQLAIMIVALVIFLRGAMKSQTLRQIGFVLAALPALACIREQDAAFDRIIPGLGWKLPFYLLVISCGVYSWRNRKTLGKQVLALINHRSFALMWAGLMVAIPFGQMIGHGPFMENIFGEDYERSMKRLIEECAETIGYLMILIASIDWTLSLRNERSPA